MGHSIQTRCLNSGRNCLRSRCSALFLSSHKVSMLFNFFYHFNTSFQTSLQSLLHQEKVLQAQLFRLQGSNSPALLRHSIDSASSTTSREPGVGLSVPEPFRASITPSLPPSKWSAPVTPPSSVIGDSSLYARSPPPARASFGTLSAFPPPPQYRFGSETLSTVVLPSPLSAASTSSHHSRCARVHTLCHISHCLQFNESQPGNSNVLRKNVRAIVIASACQRQCW